MAERRKLAAIVFVDIAGYTDKTSRDEGSALRVRERVERLIKSSALSHHGRVVKTLGDGAMLEFASAVNAVSGALDIQEQMRHLNDDLKLSEPALVRIGVHSGDVVEDGDDLFGNAVNIASRVHSLAKPGGICITREVYVQIRPILKLECEPVDGASRGRLPDAVEVFEVVGGLASDSHGARPSLLGSRRGLRNPLFAGAVALAVLAVGVAGYLTRGPREGFVKPADPAAHRILLPDWVTPGEWFELDAGDAAGELTVYFGNRKAVARVRGGVLRVQAPPDLPTAQTTISVFRGNASEPMMTQLTQVIRSRTIAMSGPPEVLYGTRDERGPNVEIPAAPSPTSPTPSASSPPSKQPSKPDVAAPRRLEAEAPMGEHALRFKGAERQGYEALVGALDTMDFSNVEKAFQSLQEPDPSILHASLAVAFAAQGKEQQTLDHIEKCKAALEKAPPDMKNEIEALLKSARGFLESHQAGRRSGGAPFKMVDAFAYSMNHETNNFAGLAMIARLIQDGKYREARRAVEFLKKEAQLSEAEAKALERMESRLAARQRGAPEPQPPPSKDGESKGLEELLLLLRCDGQ